MALAFFFMTHINGVTYKITSRIYNYLRDQISNAMIGNKIWSGRKHTKETKKKMSENNAWRGKHLPEEMRLRMIKTQQETSPKKKCILQYDLNGNFIREYSSRREVKREIGITVSLYKSHKTCGGFIWRNKTSDIIEKHIDVSKVFIDKSTDPEYWRKKFAKQIS